MHGSKDKKKEREVKGKLEVVRVLNSEPYAYQIQRLRFARHFEDVWPLPQRLCLTAL